MSLTEPGDGLWEFIKGVWYQANWRAGKAVEDKRNEKAAEALRSLAQWLRRHSDDPVGRRLNAALEAFPISEDDDDDVFLAKGRIYDEIWVRGSTFGFDDEEAPITDEACERFIKALWSGSRPPAPTKLQCIRVASGPQLIPGVNSPGR